MFENETMQDCLRHAWEAGYAVGHEDGSSDEDVSAGINSYG